MSVSGLLFLRSADTLDKPLSWPMSDFCTLVFSETENIENCTYARIDEIRHYKEKDGLEHEFLLVGVKHGEKFYLLRIERSTPARVQRTFWQKLKQTSASILPALDTVSVSSSFKKLTTDMNRGSIIHVATLPISSHNITLYDLCLLLSLFPSFSPIYKLREEQCYWFCNVVISTISSIAYINPIPEEGFKRAGKYGRLSVNVSAKARQLFIDGYQTIRGLHYGSINEFKNVNLTLDTAQALVTMLTVQSDGAKARALASVASLTSQSIKNRQLLLDSGVAEHLRLSFISSSADLKALIFLALDALGLPNFDPLLTEEPIGILPHTTQEDMFSQEDRKNRELKCINTLRDLVVLLEDSRPIVRSRSQIALTDFSRDGKHHPFVLQVIPYMVKSETSEVCLIGLNTVMDIVQHPDPCESPQEVVSRMFPVLTSRPNRDVRVAAIVSLRKLADRVHLREVCINVLPLIAFMFLNNDDCMVSKVEELHSSGSIQSVKKAIGDEFSNVELDNPYLVGLKAVSAATKHSICYPIITDNLPQIIELLSDGLPQVRKAAVDLVSSFISIFELRPLAEKAMLKVVGLLRDGDQGVRQSAVGFMIETISNSDYYSTIHECFPQMTSEFRPHVEKAIPRVFDLLRDSNDDVRQLAVEFMTKAASYQYNYHSSILDLLPQFVVLLADESWSARQAVVDLLSAISLTMFWPHITQITSRVFKLLRDSHWRVRESAVKFMTNSASDSYFYSTILELFPQIVDLLTENRSNVRKRAVLLISDLITDDSVRLYIEESIPYILGLLKVDDSDAQRAAADFLKQAAPYFHKHPALIGAIPQIACLSDGCRSSVHNDAADLLCDFMDYSNLRPHVQTVIPEVKKLLSDKDSEVRRYTRRILKEASQYQACIRTNHLGATLSLYACICRLHIV